MRESWYSSSQHNRLLWRGRQRRLAWWGDEIAPRVLRHEERFGALLMERLEPGTALGWAGAGDTAVVVPLMERMHRPLAGELLPLPLLSDLGDEELQTMREACGE